MIVCLGWGSLIWRPEELPLIDGRPEAWRDDGPELPIEFLRQSNNGCLTLVINRGSSRSRVLWNALTVTTLPDAIEALRHREGDTKSSWIGRWPNGDHFECAEVVEQWAQSRDLEGVVWTAIPAKLHGENYRRPTQSEALDYLEGLEGDSRRLAEEYVRKAPAQIDTPYRRAIADALRWNPI